MSVVNDYTLISTSDQQPALGSNSVSTAAAPATWTGVGQADLLKAIQGEQGQQPIFQNLQNNEISLAYNFPGVLGTTDFTAATLGGNYSTTPIQIYTKIGLRQF